MAKICTAVMYLVLGGALVSTVAYGDDAARCEAAKLKIAGKYDFCRLKAEATAAKTGGTPDFSKCDPNFSGKWSQAEMNGSGMCPSNGDAAAMQAFITEHTDALEAALDGGTLPEGVLTCNANLATCSTNLTTCSADLATCEEAKVGVLKTGQTTAYGTGSDGDLQRGASRSYTDNGDGTITDNKTGLMWEKKDSLDNTPNPSDPHDADNTYTWCADVNPMDGICDNGTNDMDGTIVTTFLVALNAGSGFAGHTDWRIPNLSELQSIANYQTAIPAADAVFSANCVASCTVTTCSCTVGGYYWSTTTYQFMPLSAWFVDFFGGFVTVNPKPNANQVRAVRGGS
jgi:hypothetical protein